MPTDGSSPRVIDYDEEDWIIGGGDVEGVPNSGDGGSSPTAPRSMSSAALRACHVNLTQLDGTSEDQSLWIGPVWSAIKMNALVEEQLVKARELGVERAQKNLEQEFLVTKTVGNAEVWANLKDWEQSIRKEYDQLVTQKCAVRQITKEHLQRMSSERKLPIELLPAKVVNTRKAYSWAYRSRAGVCGNDAGPDESEHYAGGVDGNIWQPDSNDAEAWCIEVLDGGMYWHPYRFFERPLQRRNASYGHGDDSDCVQEVGPCWIQRSLVDRQGHLWTYNIASRLESVSR